MKSSTPKKSGEGSMGRFVSVRTIAFSPKDANDAVVIITCDGGNCSFQHNMTPTEARELAGYLQAEADYAEQQNKELEADRAAIAKAEGGAA